MSIKKPTRIVDKELIEECRKQNCSVYGCCDLNVVGHHIKSKGSGGHDLEENLLPLCVKHHHEIHTTGTNNFCDKYPNIKEILEEKGWIFNGRKWQFPNLY